MTQDQYLSIIFISILAYLLGSIPFGLLVTKIAGLGDIRKIGSGNIGATNVLRTGKKSLALLTVLLDGGKGALAVYMGLCYCQCPHTKGFFDCLSDLLDCTYLAAFAVFIGHLFPVWLKFKGGKGVATTFGILLALAWPVGVGALAVWIMVALVTRYSSLAALVSFGLVPVAAFFLNLEHIQGTGRITLFMGTIHGAFLGLTLFAFMAYKHKDNIQRLLAGTESKIGKGNDDATAQTE